MTGMKDYSVSNFHRFQSSMTGFEVDPDEVGGDLNDESMFHQRSDVARWFAVWEAYLKIINGG